MNVTIIKQKKTVNTSGFTVNCNFCELASAASLHNITNEWLAAESDVDPAVTRQLQSAVGKYGHEAASRTRD